MAEKSKVVSIPDRLSVRELAVLLDVSPIEVMKLLISSGIMANINEKVYFQARSSGAGTELWVSDGTSPGTMLVADIIPGVSSISGT